MLIVPNMYFFCTSSRSTCKHRYTAEEVISKSDTSMHSGISVLHMRADTCSLFSCQRSRVIELMCLEEPGEFTQPVSGTNAQELLENHAKDGLCCPALSSVRSLDLDMHGLIHTESRIILSSWFMPAGASASHNMPHCCDGRVNLMVLNEGCRGQRVSIISFWKWYYFFCHLGVLAENCHHFLPWCSK